MGSKRLPVFALVAASSLTLACIFQRVAIESPSLAPNQPRRFIAGSVKAHLVDGTTVLFRDSATLVVRPCWSGRGERFDLALRPAGAIDHVMIDSVVALESFSTKIRPAETFLASAVRRRPRVRSPIGGIADRDRLRDGPQVFRLLPTAYSDSAGVAVLEAEGFSYSIAPLFEMRDVDRLRARPDSDGSASPRRSGTRRSKPTSSTTSSCSRWITRRTRSSVP